MRTGGRTVPESGVVPGWVAGWRGSSAGNQLGSERGVPKMGSRSPVGSASEVQVVSVWSAEP